MQTRRLSDQTIKERPSNTSSIRGAQAKADREYDAQPTAIYTDATGFIEQLCEADFNKAQVWLMEIR